jgi:3-methyladenine DNA glycosylase Mpg
MHIDMRYDGVDLCATEPLWLGTAARPEGTIGSSTRIGLKREIHREHRKEGLAQSSTLRTYAVEQALSKTSLSELVRGVGQICPKL